MEKKVYTVEVRQTEKGYYVSNQGMEDAMRKYRDAMEGQGRKSCDILYRDLRLLGPDAEDRTKRIVHFGSPEIREDNECAVEHTLVRVDSLDVEAEDEGEAFRKADKMVGTDMPHGKVLADHIRQCASLLDDIDRIAADPTNAADADAMMRHAGRRILDALCAQGDKDRKDVARGEDFEKAMQREACVERTLRGMTPAGPLTVRLVLPGEREVVTAEDEIRKTFPDTATAYTDRRTMEVDVRPKDRLDVIAFYDWMREHKDWAWTVEDTPARARLVRMCVNDVNEDEIIGFLAPPHAPLTAMQREMVRYTYHEGAEDGSHKGYLIHPSTTGKSDFIKEHTPGDEGQMMLLYEDYNEYGADEYVEDIRPLDDDGLRISMVPAFGGERMCVRACRDGQVSESQYLCGGDLITFQRYARLATPGELTDLRKMIAYRLLKDEDNGLGLDLKTLTERTKMKL